MATTARIGTLLTHMAGPQGADPHSMLVLLHGRGADGRDLVGLAPFLEFPGRLLCPDAPIPWEEGGGLCWYREPSMREDMERSLGALMDFLDAALAQYPTTGRPILGGFSQGGVVAYEAVLRRPERFAGLVAMSAFLAPDHPARDTPPAPSAIPPILVTHGTYDPLVDVERGREAVGFLRQLRLQPEVVEDTCAHSISPRHLQALTQFLGGLTGA